MKTWYLMLLVKNSGWLTRINILNTSFNNKFLVIYVFSNTMTSSFRPQKTQKLQLSFALYLKLWYCLLRIDDYSHEYP